MRFRTAHADNFKCFLCGAVARSLQNNWRRRARGANLIRNASGCSKQWLGGTRLPRDDKGAEIGAKVHTVTGGHLISGKNPASSGPAAKVLSEKLNEMRMSHQGTFEPTG